MARTKSSSDVNVTAFELLNSIIGELPVLPTQKKIAADILSDAEE
jgi:hypothetical protein